MTKMRYLHVFLTALVVVQNPFCEALRRQHHGLQKRRQLSGTVHDPKALHATGKENEEWIRKGDGSGYEKYETRSPTEYHTKDEGGSKGTKGTKSHEASTKTKGKGAKAEDGKGSKGGNGKGTKGNGSKSKGSKSKGSGGKGAPVTHPPSTSHPTSVPSSVKGEYRPPISLSPTADVTAESETVTVVATEASQGALTQAASPYTIEFDTGSSSMPERRHLDDLEAVTASYVEAFLMNEFEGTSMTILDEVSTNEEESSMDFGGVVRVHYSSVAHFGSNSEVLPSVAQLDEAIVSAFTGDNLLSYINLLADLPDDNIFKHATAILIPWANGAPATKSGQQDENISTSREGFSMSTGAIAAGAVAGVLLVGGVLVLYRRSYTRSEVEDSKDEKFCGEATIAGETCADTYDGTMSIESASLDYGFQRPPLEEHYDAPYVNQLDPIDEDQDDSSILPAWDEDSLEESMSKPHNSHDVPSLCSDQELSISTAEDEASVSSSTSLEADREGCRSGSDIHEQVLDNADASEATPSGIQTDLRIQDTKAEDKISHFHRGQRPRTVAEIEALLALEQCDTKSDSGHKSRTTGSSGPRRSIAEIESMLYDDDFQDEF